MPRDAAILQGGEDAGKVSGSAEGGRSALAAKRGKIKKSELKGASKSMAKSMTEVQLDELASTKRKGKPEHASKS